MNGVKLTQIIQYNGAAAVRRWADETVPLLLQTNDAIELLAYLTKHQVAIKQMIERTREHVIPRITKQVENYHGVEFSKRGTGKWKYDHDETWVKLNAALEAHQELMKSITVPLDRLDSDTGEVVTIKPATKDDKDSLVVKFV